jgi:multiple sugar transport system permease protein
MKRIIGTLRKIPLIILVIIVLLPFIYTLTNSFMNMNEIMRYYGNLRTITPFHIIPDSFSLAGYYGVLVRHPYFLTAFWNSLLLVVTIVIGQLIVSALAGYAFTYFNFRMRNFLFFLVIILMMMPYQVTLVSNYKVNNTYLSLLYIFEHSRLELPNELDYMFLQKTPIERLYGLFKV